MASAGSKEARELEKVKRVFEKAYKESVDVKNTADEGGARYSIQYEKATVNNDIVSLVEKVKNKDYKDNDFVDLGIVSDKAVGKIKEILGVDVSGYKVVIEARQIKHILKGHGEQGRTDHSMANDVDIGKMEYVFKNFDSVVDGGRTEAYFEMKNGHNRTARTVLYEKEIGEQSYYVVQAVPETKRKTLFVVSTYIGKKGQKKKPLGSSMLNSPDATSTTVASATSNDSISGITENVKQDGNLSLSGENIAPKKYGNYNVYGEDVMLEGKTKPTGKREFTAPTRESIAEKRQTVKENKFPMLDDDILVRKDIRNDLLSRSAKSYGITKPGDYVQVQRQVFDTLNNEGFFSDKDNRSRTVTNRNSSMQVEINKSGIKETFNFDNYGKFSRKYKGIKLATVRELPKIIENGRLINDNVDNYHNEESSVKFAYIESEVKIDGQNIAVKIDIKKSPQKNKFWVHSIDVKEKVDGVPVNDSESLERGYSPTNSIDSISNTEGIVNSENNASEEREAISRDYDDIAEFGMDEFEVEYEDNVKKLEEEAAKKIEDYKASELTGKGLHTKIVDDIKTKFTEKGFDLDKVLSEAKNLSTFSTVDNIPQRVMEKALGYKPGQILADETVKKR